MDYLLPADIVALAKRVVTENAKIGRKVAVAESCTGGLIAAALTEIAGSSSVFSSGFVTYSDEAKKEILDVNSDLIETFGAVSIATVWAMAQGALKLSDADVAVGVSGIAGPGGGSEQKPVGTVVFAKAERGEDPDDVVAERKDLGDYHSRAEIRRKAAIYALELLLPPA